MSQSEHGPEALAPLPPRGRRPLRRAAIVAAVLVGVLVVITGVIGAMAWVLHAYALRAENGVVVVDETVRHVRHLHHRTTEVEVAGLPAADVTHLRAGWVVRSEKQLDGVLAGLAADVRHCATTVLDGCPTTGVHVPVIAAAGLQFPRGDHIVISWGGVDLRAGVTTTITVNGHRPPQGCPQTISTPSTCTFIGAWHTRYTVRVVTTAPGVAPRRAGTVGTTQVRPYIRVRPGHRARSGGDVYCDVRLTGAGFPPLTSQKYSSTYDGLPGPRVHTEHDTLWIDADGRVDTVVDSYSSPVGGFWTVKLLGLTTTYRPWNCP